MASDKPYCKNARKPLNSEAYNKNPEIKSETVTYKKIRLHDDKDMFRRY